MLRPIIGLLALGLLSPAQAAESYDNCTGTITSIPTTISTQGTWCLKGNLGTSITTGSAIVIATNNVTLNCNDFRIGGLAGGVGTNAIGVSAASQLNTTIRNCGIRGFLEGVRISGASAGALIEHNRLDGNTKAGIVLEGSGHMVRFNRIIDTGGRPASTQTDGVLSIADETQITDNTIIGMTVTENEGDVVAITSFGNANEVARNYIAGLVSDDTGVEFGIVTGNGTASTIHRNQILSFPDNNGTAISSTADNQCTNNNTTGWDSGIVGCDTLGGGNYSN